MRESLPILGDLDHLRGQPGDRDIGIGEVLRKVDRGLSSEREDDGGRRPGQRPLVIDDIDDIDVLVEVSFTSAPMRQIVEPLTRSLDVT